MRKKFISKLLALAMSVSLISGVSQPALAAQTATISGTLRDANGAVLANKTVTLRERSAKDKGSRYTATTDANGNYTAVVPAGDYQVIGLPYEFNPAKLMGTSDMNQVCAVVQSVVVAEGTQVKQDLNVPVPVEVPNGEFDIGTGESQDMANWTFGEGTTGKYRNKSKDRHSGDGHLTIWTTNAFTVDVSQQLTGLEEGTYTIQYSLEAEVEDGDEVYFYVKDANGNILAREDVRTTLSEEYVYEVFGMTVKVAGGPITIGVVGNCSGSKWLNVDELRMGKLSATQGYTKVELRTLLDSAAAYTAEGYTPASFETLSTARTNAQTVCDKEAASDSEITAAYQALQSAIDGLVPAMADGAPGIRNDVFRRDTDGNIIYSQGGGIFKFNNTYYWYGVKYEEAEKYANNPSTSYDTDVFAGVTCYSSKDLVNWKYEGLVVKPSEVNGHADIKGKDAVWVGRLGVAKVGDRYALFVQHECEEATQNYNDTLDYPDGATEGSGPYEGKYYSKQVLVLTAGAPNGDFKWNQRINMCSYTGEGVPQNGTSNTGDQTVFTDEDTGKSYLVYSYGRGRGSMFLSEIVAQENGKVGLAKAHKIYQGAGREGNCMFKYKNKYYVCASDLYGWNASHAYYLVLNSLEDTYLDSFSPITNMTLMDGSSDDFCHVSQTGFFYTVKGSQQETVIFCGDRWADFARNGLGYNQWCPLSFKANGIPYFNSLSAWDLNVATGRWSVHGSNNYVKNGSFDADRVNSTQLAGWTNEINKGTAPINNNKETTTGKYALKLGDSVDFDCQVSQVIAQDTKTADAVVLPNGTYNLTAKVKNSGTFEELSLYVKSGKLTKKAIIKQANTKYTEVTLKNVTVTGKKAEVGFIAKGKAKAYALIDDVSFVRSSEQSADTESIEMPITSNETKNRNMTVTVVSEDGATAYVYEDELTSGTKTYTVSPVKAGKYAVKIAVNASEVQGGTQEVTVMAGQAAQIPAVTITSISGNVSGKVVDENGAGIAGVNVTLTKGDDVIKTKTQENGTYSISDIIAGTYTVQMEKEGYISPQQFDITVAVGQTAQAAQQTLKTAIGTVTGTVMSVDGAPVADATVTLRGCKTKSSEKRYTVTTDAEGKFSVQVIEDTYQILASKAGVAVEGVSERKITVVRDKTCAAEVIIPEAVPVPNGDFENNFTSDSSWTNTGSRGKWTNRAGDVLSGKGGYNIWDAQAAFTVELNQTLNNLPNGTYVVNVKAESGFNEEDELYLYAKNASGKLLAREDFPNISVKVKGEVIGLVAVVTDGTLTIGLSGNMSGGAWSHVDDFSVGRIKDEDHSIQGIAEVENLINQIGTVEATPECKARIDAAKKAFDELTDAKKAIVSNVDILEAAEAEYEMLFNLVVDISKATVAPIEAQIYTGKELKPAVKVTYDGKTLVKDTDYKVDYSNNKNIGKATVKITGIGKYEKSVTKDFTITVKKNTIYTVGSYKYNITGAKTDGKGTVAVTGGKKKTLKSVKIGATVKIGGKKFKITSIGKGAFKGYKKLTSVTIGGNVTKIDQSAFEKCAKLKKIKISSTKLKSVGKNAIKGINKKAVIQCPKKQLAKYKKLFKSSTGYKKTMKIKK